MHPKNLSISTFTYSLPEEKIASYPQANRDSSKLLVYKEQKITEDIYRNIATYIPSDSFLIFNDTRVVEARLIFQKPTGGNIEIFCLEPHEQYKDITSAMQQKGMVWWQCLVGGASKWKHGQVLKKIVYAFNKEVLLEAIFKEKRTDCFIIELSWTDTEMDFASLLHYAGAIPLPPYIKRKAEPDDKERYQTIYARQDGSVAAPTAGLHFTKDIFDSLEKKNIQTDFLTLHVGAGTFKPVKNDTLELHEMHSEYINVSKKIIEKIIFHLDKTIIPVGTTSLRTIESLYWLGVKTIELKKDKNICDPEFFMLGQWEPYEMSDRDITALSALQSLVEWMETNKMKRLITKTQLIIAPGYKLRIAKALITNFHQPRSTLLLIIAALIGDDWRKVYDHALQNEFRFLSYGDGCLVWENKT